MKGKEPQRDIKGTYGLIWAGNEETGKEKFFLSNAAKDTPIETLLRAAFERWEVEHSFRMAKSETTQASDREINVAL